MVERRKWWQRKERGYRSLGISIRSDEFGRTVILSLWRWERYWHRRNEETWAKVLEETKRALSRTA